MPNKIIPSWVPDYIRDKANLFSKDSLKKEEPILFRLVSDSRMESVYKNLKRFPNQATYNFILYSYSIARDMEFYKTISKIDYKDHLKKISKTAVLLAKELKKLEKTGVELPLKLKNLWSLLPNNYPIKISIKDQKEIEKKLKRKIEITTSPKFVRKRYDDPKLIDILNKVAQLAEKAGKENPRYWWETDVGVKIPKKKFEKEILKKTIMVRKLGEHTKSEFDTPLHNIIAITTTVALNLEPDLLGEEVRDIIRTGK